MTTMTLPPPTRAVSADPQPLRWACDEFHIANEAGAFAGRRPMLIDGVILDQGPMKSPHATTLSLVANAIQAAFGVGWWYRHQSPLVLSQEIDPMPDLAVMPGDPADHDDDDGHPTTAVLVVETADTSLPYDTGYKRTVYARGGIPEYWVVDINGRRLFVYRDPRNGDYASQQTLGPADTVTLLAVPATVSVASLLPRIKPPGQPAAKTP